MSFLVKMREYFKVHPSHQNIVALSNSMKFVLQCLFDFKYLKIRQFLHEIARWKFFRGKMLPPLKGVFVNKGVFVKKGVVR